jgi:hypothetical protein
MNSANNSQYKKKKKKKKKNINETIKKIFEMDLTKNKKKIRINIIIKYFSKSLIFSFLSLKKKQKSKEDGSKPHSWQVGHSVQICPIIELPASFSGVM